MADDTKIKALHNHILEKCREQGVTVDEFETVLRKLSYAVSRRKIEITDSVMIPKDAPISNYYHIF